MTTYTQSAYNDFETPSGAAGDGLNPPAEMAHLRDQIDARIGIGGAEYCASTSAVQAIPTTRVFVGKLAFCAANGITYMYVGAGNVTASDAPGTAAWQGWDKPATAFTPNWSGIGFTSLTYNTGLYGLSSGTLWVHARILANNAPTPSTSAEATVQLPLSAIASAGVGQGLWASGSSFGTNNVHDIVARLTGTAGASSTNLNLRVRVANATGSSVKHNPYLGTYITASASDLLTVSYNGPSGAYL